MSDSSKNLVRRSAAMPENVFERASEIAQTERRSLAAQLGIWVTEGVEAYERRRGDRLAADVPERETDAKQH